jgi:hypothetical protein
MARRIAASIIALAFTASSALALTITNKSGKEETVGIDYGNSEKVETVAPGKSVKIDGCDEECGVTGIWGYSWMAKTGDTLVFDENGLKPSNL